MILLILGLILWIGAHSFKRLAPGARARMGTKGRGPIALTILVSVALMVLGYRAAEFTSIYTPIPGIGHLNNLLMLIAVFFFGIGSAKGVLADKIRHPMLTGMVIFAMCASAGEWRSGVNPAFRRAGPLGRDPDAADQPRR